MNSKMKIVYILTGIGLMGYLYLMKNPKKVLTMKQIGKEASRKMYNMFDED